VPRPDITGIHPDIGPTGDGATQQTGSIGQMAALCLGAMASAGGTPTIAARRVDRRPFRVACFLTTLIAGAPALLSCLMTMAIARITTSWNPLPTRAMHGRLAIFRVGENHATAASCSTSSHT